VKLVAAVDRTPQACVRETKARSASVAASNRALASQKRILSPPLGAWGSSVRMRLPAELTVGDGL
jgi:hypothetical protein